jgi:hypothetical protein
MARVDLSLREIKQAQVAMGELQNAQANAREVLSQYIEEGIPNSDPRVKNIRHVMANNRRGKDGLRALNNALESEPYNK